MFVGSSERALRVAVIGSGPSAFYAVDALLKQDMKTQIDIFEMLPMPFGLVRYGVAPDHPKIKNVTRIYEKVLAHENVQFWGNVTIGRDLTMDELKQHYDTVIVASGAQSDKHLPIPGVDLENSHSATEFVAWYNGHPDFVNHQFDLSGESAVIIGHGNVALDVARILAKTPDELRETDIADYALKALADSNIKTIHLVGRRGPVQATFTDHEVKEFGDLSDCRVTILTDDMQLAAEDEAELNVPENGFVRKNIAALQKLIDMPVNESASRELKFHFYRSPLEILGDSHVRTLKIERNDLEGVAGHRKVVATGDVDEIACDFFVRSIGYRGVAIEGIPFDESWGVIPHDDGRVQGMNGVYVVGWIKRGPSGVIGTNKPDSVHTVETVLSDLETLVPCSVPDSQSVRALLDSRDVRVISYDDWKRIDAEEIRRGEALGQTRKKMTTLVEVLEFLSS